MHFAPKNMAAVGELSASGELNGCINFWQTHTEEQFTSVSIVDTDQTNHESSTDGGAMVCANHNCLDVVVSIVDHQISIY